MKFLFIFSFLIVSQTVEISWKKHRKFKILKSATTPNPKKKKQIRFKKLGDDQQIEDEQYLRIGACKRLRVQTEQHVAGEKLKCIYNNEYDGVSKRDHMICKYYLDQMQVKNLLPYNCMGDSYFGKDLVNEISIMNVNPENDLIQIQIDDLEACPQRGFTCLKSAEQIMKNQKRFKKIVQITKKQPSKFESQNNLKQNKISKNNMKH